MASTRIYRTLASTGTNGKLTISFWVKRAKLGSDQEIISTHYSGSYYATVRFLSDDTLEFRDYRTTEIMRRVTNRVFRDTNSWYHIVCNFDNSLGTTSQKVFVNGVEETSFSSSVDYSTDAITSWNTDYLHEIGCRNSSSYFDGSLSDLYFIQGQQYDASTFGETDATTGEWKPNTNPTIDYSCTGTNSYHLKFANSSNMDLDSGDNTVSFTTAGNLTQTEDNPSDVFATMNPLVTDTDMSFINGNTTQQRTSGSWDYSVSTLGANKGKFYFEGKIGGSGHWILGATSDIDGIGELGNGTGDTGWRNSGGVKVSGSEPGYSPSVSYTSSDVVCVAMDLDNRKIYFRKNADAWINSGDPTSGATGTGAFALDNTTDTYFFGVCSYITSGTGTWDINFGNGYFGTTIISSDGTNASNIGKFEYDVPTGYTALSTKGLNE